jgi:hypothetical protein
MKHVILAAIALCTLATACSVKTERTVVAAPAPGPAPATIVYTDPTAPPATTTTVYTR